MEILERETTLMDPPKIVEDDVITFLSNIGEERGESYAMHFIQDCTSVRL
jgi:hypothetical protein